MTSYEIHKAMREAFSAELPVLLKKVIDVKSRVEELPDYPTQSQVAQALGISKSTVSRYLREGTVTKHYLRDSTIPRLIKSEVIDIIIQERLISI